LNGFLGYKKPAIDIVETGVPQIFWWYFLFNISLMRCEVIGDVL
jgi:hypothetical protein